MGEKLRNPDPTYHANTYAELMQYLSVIPVIFTALIYKSVEL